jgi:hypothetical protein
MADLIHPVYGARPSKACHSASLRLLLHEEFSWRFQRWRQRCCVDMVEGRIGVRRGAPQEEPAALSGAFD